MQIIDGRFYYSASDLNNYLECAHLTALDLQAASGPLTRPKRAPGTAQIVAQKGIEHEKRYLARLHDEGFSVTELPESCAPTIADLRAAEDATIAAMSKGAPFIYQGAFFDGEFIGRSDFLIRIPRPSKRWSTHSYEVLDTKLALHSQPYFLLQLCHYSEQLRRIQGTAPEFMHVLLGNGNRDVYRVSDYSAYYHQLRKSFLRDAEGRSEATYPVPTNHCDVCSWNEVCVAQRRDDDYLRLVASMRNDQVARFSVAGISKVAELAVAPDEARPRGMGIDTFERLREQAALQIRQRDTNSYHYKLLDHELWAGFGLMPEPATGDVFFDMEGDPLFEIGTGLEYLFGCWMPDDEPHFKAIWALDRSQEKVAFEQFVDFIVARRRQYTAMHVYHYAPYEKSALRKLAQRHTTREEEVDELLKAEVFVDLYAVVRQALMISQESYSIKKLEPFYDFVRTADLRKGDDSIVMFEQWRAAPESKKILKEIERYNEDDCRSTIMLREWLLQRRLEYRNNRGVDIPFRPLKKSDEPCHEPTVTGCKSCLSREQKEREDAKTSATQRALLDGILLPQTDEELRALSEDERSRYLLANLMAYHRRSDKPVFWKLFDRCENVDTLIEFDKDCLGGLVLDESVAPYQDRPGEKNLTWVYHFPDQQYDSGMGSVVDPETREKVGDVVEINENNYSVKIKLCKDFQDKARLVKTLIPHDHINAGPQKAALQRIGAEYLDGSVKSAALLDLLRASAPRFDNLPEGANVQPTVVSVEALHELVAHLDSSVLFIQGPPGTGKSTKVSKVIAALLKEGKRIGVMSNSHKAIHLLDAKIEAAAIALPTSFNGVHKASGTNKGSSYESKIGFIRCVSHNKQIDSGDFDLISGNAWLFARPEMAGRLDYLFIDEAGQISLADAISVAESARNVVVVGDPLQLAQVSQGTHPIGVGISVLQHLLGDHETIPPTRGVFLDETYRLHPATCAFISNALYEGRLRPAASTANHSIGSPPAFGNGLRYLPIHHTGNSRESLEEAEKVAQVVAELIGSPLVDEHGSSRTATVADVIVVSPYNAQRRLIRQLLRQRGLEKVEVGTVDKFQGEEAFAVIYSMATSSDKDAPRGLEFLLDKNRFNVAISRCKALPIVICSDALIESRCRSVTDMGLLSLLCSYAQTADQQSASSLTARARTKR